MTVDDVRARFDDVRPTGGGWMARCPAHDDRKASLSISAGIDGRTVLYCHAGCTLDAILGATDLAAADLFPSRTGRPRVVATYDYCDERGAVLYQVVRFEPKDFRQRRPDGRGGQIWNLGDVRRVLFSLPTLQEQPLVYVTEGEKDALALRPLGLVATCNAGGAGKWTPDYTQQLVQAGVQRVVVLPDNDEPGRAHSVAVATSCYAAGISVKLVALPGVPEKGDVSDYLAAGHTRADIETLVDAAIDWTPKVAPDLETRGQARAARARAALPALEPLSVTLARPVKPLQWVFDRLQPRGSRALLSAQYKSGKTTVIGNLARSWADAEPLMGTFTAAPTAGAFVVLDFEMSESMIAGWYRDQGIRNTDRVIVVPMRGRASEFNLLDPNMLDAWADHLRAASAAYLVVDCVRPLMDALGLDEHKDGGRLLEKVDALLQKANIDAACVVQHMGHNGERARGDSRFRDWPDVEWQLVRKTDESASPRFFKAYGRDVDVPESQLEFDATTRRLTLVGGSRSEAASEAVLADVLTCLTGDDGQSARAIQSALKDTHPREAIRVALRYGVKVGTLVVHRGPRGADLYRLSPTYRASAPVRRSAPLVSQSSASECASPFRDGALAHSLGIGTSAPNTEEDYVDAGRV